MLGNFLLYFGEFNNIVGFFVVYFFFIVNWWKLWIVEINCVIDLVDCFWFIKCFKYFWINCWFIKLICEIWCLVI